MKRHKILMLLGVLALTAFACGGGAATETATPTVTPAELTATPAPTDTPEEPSGYDWAKEFEGSWTGSWHNETFDTTGSSEMTVVVREDGTFDMTLDLGGMVFGALDPPPVTFTGTYTAEASASGGAQGDPTFGDITFTITPDGEVTARMEGVMGGSGIVEVTGTVTPERLDLQYSIPIFSATGTLTMEHQ